MQPKGNIEGQRQELPIDTNDQLTNAAQFRQVIVAYKNGAPVQLGNIAIVSDGSVGNRTGSWYGTKLSEVLLIERAPGANTLDVVDSVKAALPQLEKSIPRSVHVDLSRTARRRSAPRSRTSNSRSSSRSRSW